MNELLSKFSKTKKICIYGKRWFQKTYGNTYHSVEIYVNDILVHKIECSYGYGSQYEWNARLWLKNNNYIQMSDKNEYFCLGRYCRENNIEYENNVIDVKRKKDLI